MRLRRSALSAGWYPRDPAELRRLLDAWTGKAGAGRARASVAPHAGFAYSGRLAARAWAALAPAETYVIIGGHLPARGPLLLAMEEGFESPFGELRADLELRGRLLEALGAASLGWEEDGQADNSVEIQLPFLGRLAPGARLLWLRAPAGEASLGLGRALHEAAESLGRRVAILASTDLTHYGPDYGFEPRGRGAEAERWVREVNDRRFLQALEAREPELLLELAGRESSACSPGGVAAALAFLELASPEGFTVEELAYATSLEIRPALSFVGYAAAALGPAA